MSTGVKKLAIGALAPDINNSLVIGVIIAKQSVRIFTSRKDGEERGVWNFTIRDSTVDTINIAFWGSAEGAKKSCDNFEIGDVVQVMNARVLFKQPSTEAAFSPSVSSPFQLQLQENNSALLLYNEDDANEIRHLIRIPTKPAGDFLRLSDLFSYGQAMKGDYVNILVAIRNINFKHDTLMSVYISDTNLTAGRCISFVAIGPIRTVTSRKDSRDLLCRDITVMDQSHLEFKMTLWEDDNIKRANSWHAQQTVIFFADVRLDWNNFKQSVTAVITSRTIITENPNTSEAQVLRRYAETFPLQPIAVIDRLTKSVGDPYAITTIMTTAQILEKAWNNNGVSDKFTVLLFAVITSLNIDGSDVPVTYKCPMCSLFLDESEKCMNSECALVSQSHLLPTPIYDIKINLTDHRGSLFSCRLLSPVADEVLNCPVQEYLTLSPAAKTELKWELLLSRCEIRLLTLCPSSERTFPIFSVLTCKKANFKAVASNLPMY